MDSRNRSQTRFRIVVNGRLSERIGSAINGVTIQQLSGQTALTAEFIDGTQLYGLLDRLRDLGIELVSVNSVEDSEVGS